MAENDQPTNEGAKRKDNRRTFSVSKGFKEVHTILDNLPDNEMSRFVCEAIKHYHQVKSNPNWMGEQLQEIFHTQAQLHQMIAGFGVTLPQNQQPSAQMMPPNYGMPYQQVPLQNPGSMYPASPPVVQDQVGMDQSQTSPTLPQGTNGGSPTAHEVVEHAIKQIAVADNDNTINSNVQTESKDDEVAEISETASPTVETKPRRKSSFGQSLTNRSMGKVDK